MAFRYRILLLGAVFLILFFSIRALNLFPLPKDDVLEEKTDGFSGVLRLWVSKEDYPITNRLISWLTKESAYFERKHDGVYVQITPVTKNALASFSYASNLPPDMIVFSPGTLETVQGLMRTDASRLLREEFQNYASGLCTPIAMGASFWAVREGVVAPLSGKTLLFQKGCESAALYALKNDLPSRKTPHMQYSVDLGLPTDAENNNDLIMEEVSEISPGVSSRILENAYLSFIKGEGDCVFLTDKDLPSLINAACAPEFEIAMSGAFYQDLLALFAVTDTKTGEAREMCGLFLEHLLSEEAQMRLESAKVFSVTSANLYQGKAHYQEIELLLASASILPAPAFSPTNQNASYKLQAIISGEKPSGDAPSVRNPT